MANAKRVRSLAEALEVAAELGDVLGFQVAPLSTLNGGRRSWHGLDPRDATKWLSEAEGNDDVEPAIPSPFDAPESFPTLPPSRIGLWEVCFLVSSPNEADMLRLPTRVLIEQPRRTIREEAPESFHHTGTVSGGDLNSSVVAMMAQQNKFTLDMLKAQQNMLSVLSDEQQKLTASIREQHERTKKDLERTQQDRDAALGSNSLLSLQVAELKSESQIGMVVGKLIEKDPKALWDGLGSLANGVISLIRGPEAA